MSSSMYLALDIGEKRIGAAVGRIVPFGRGIIHADGAKEDVLRAIKQLVSREGVTKVIVGMPVVSSGEVSPSQQLVLEWADRIQDELNLPLEMVDESYTSVEAERQLRAEGVDTEKEKWRIDERSAQLILAQYLAEQA